MGQMLSHLPHAIGYIWADATLSWRDKVFGGLTLCDAVFRGKSAAKYISYADYIYYLRSSSASGKIFPFNVEQSCFCRYIKQMKRLSALAGVDLMQTPSSSSILVMLFARVRNCMYMLGELTRKKRVWFYQIGDIWSENTILNSLQSSNMLVRIGYKLFMANGYWYLLDAYFYVMMNLKRLLSKKRWVEWSIFYLTTGSNDWDGLIWCGVFVCSWWYCITVERRNYTKDFISPFFYPVSFYIGLSFFESTEVFWWKTEIYSCCRDFANPLFSVCYADLFRKSTLCRGMAAR